MGLDSDLANDEVAFLVLEGAMVAISAVTLSVAHPGVAFQSLWSKANFQLLNRKSQRVHSQHVIIGDMELGHYNMRDS